MNQILSVCLFFFTSFYIITMLALTDMKLILIRYREAKGVSCLSSIAADEQ